MYMNFRKKQFPCIHYIYYADFRVEFLQNICNICLRLNAL